MMDAEWARLIYLELQKTAEQSNWNDRQKVLSLGIFMEKLFGQLTRQEQIAFSTLFARISYVGHIHQLPDAVVSGLQFFRRTLQRTRQGAFAGPSAWQEGLTALGSMIEVLTGAPPPDALTVHFRPSGPVVDSAKRNAHFPSLRVVAVQDMPHEQYLIAYDDGPHGEPLKVQYGLPDRNENFGPTIKALRSVFGFPVTLNLIDVEVDSGQVCKPKAIVVEPDYLVDVSAVSECFKEYGAEPLYHLVKKFMPYEVTPPILLGNIANHMLDRLLYNTEAVFSDLFKETFAMYPLVYAPMPDAEVKALGHRAKKHFACLKEMSKSGFEKQGIYATASFVEPSFFSPKYGIQGRLDMFYRENDRAAIVELKSGKPFRPNSYGISRSHFTQTLLYDLITRSVYGDALNPAKYILYSGESENQLRFAPTVHAEQWEAVQVRNQVVAIERLLAGIMPGTETSPVFSRLQGRAFSGKGFLERDIQRFETAFRSLSTTERKYVLAFVGFIAREHWLSKCGVEGSEQVMGHAALWRLSAEEKEQAFSIMGGLELIDNKADHEDPLLVFNRSTATNPLANFRVGDIAVLYPVEGPQDNVTAHQIIKCSIVSLNKDTVTVALRYRQSNMTPFRHSGRWALEPDLLDSSFIGLYRSLFEWMEAPKEVRARILDPSWWQAGTSRQATPLTLQTTRQESGPVLTDEQKGLLQKMTEQDGYFLLWGPPGTGKTSVMLRAYVDWVLNHTTDNILLMAYTNRAVDEICEAIEGLRPDLRSLYFRVGSRFSTSEAYRGQLLSHHVAHAASRAELLELLSSRRIVVSTVASFMHNSSLLSLHPFQRLLIDEASQLLEPQLLGLLTHFRTAVLVGDHRQLPAVVAQQPETTVVRDADLEAIGLHDLRDSYFERMYRRCLQLKLDAHVGQLSRQGRMHTALMDFPNTHFYEGKLSTLGQEPGHRQQAALHEGTWPVGLSPLPEGYSLTNPEKLGSLRVAFIPTPESNQVPGSKTNPKEAEMICWLVNYFQAWYDLTGKTWDPERSLGIITPWRAQIAQIRQVLEAAGIDPDAFTIDTVERYQGGARDIILISTALSASYQLESLVSLSLEGVDRKLNVALTRAREHLFMLGDAHILQMDTRYKAFIEAYSVA